MAPRPSLGPHDASLTQEPHLGHISLAPRYHLATTSLAPCWHLARTSHALARTSTSLAPFRRQAHAHGERSQLPLPWPATSSSSVVPPSYDTARVTLAAGRAELQSGEELGWRPNLPAHLLPAPVEHF